MLRNNDAHVWDVLNTIRSILVCIIVILLVALVTSPVHGAKYEDELKKIALSLNSTSINETVENVDRWVQENTEYNQSMRIRSLDWVWKTKQADCTERAQLKVMMLKYLGVEARVVYGYIVDGRDKERHDWFEYTATHKRKAWTSIEQRLFWQELRRVGIGGW